MLHVFAVHVAKPGLREAVLKEVDAVLPIVRAEAGCLEYVAAVDAEGGPAMLTKLGPDGFVIVERWADRGALEAHGSSGHMAEFRARIADLVHSRSFFVVEERQPGRA